MRTSSLIAGAAVAAIVFAAGPVHALDGSPSPNAVGGPIALIRDGDIIEIDAVKGTMNVQLSAAELEKRRKAWKPRKIDFGSGYIWKYAQQVGDALHGAVTHPGGAGETSCYADI